MATQAPTPSPTPTPLKVARAAFDALSKRDLDTLSEFHTARDGGRLCGHRRVPGQDIHPTVLRRTVRRLPRLEMTVDRIVGDRSTAVVQWHATGTFSGGKFQGIEPTGKHVETRGVDVMEITDGQVVHDTIYYDGASFARQIGMLPGSGSGMDKAMLSVFNAVTRRRQRLP